MYRALTLLSLSLRREGEVSVDTQWGDQDFQWHLVAPWNWWHFFNLKFNSISISIPFEVMSLWSFLLYLFVFNFKFCCSIIALVYSIIQVQFYILSITFMSFYILLVNSTFRMLTWFSRLVWEKNCHCDLELMMEFLVLIYELMMMNS